jgi:hypothetical protein
MAYLAEAQCCETGESDRGFICFEGRTYKIQMICREQKFEEITLPPWSVLPRYYEWIHDPRKGTYKMRE